MTLSSVGLVRILHMNHRFLIHEAPVSGTSVQLFGEELHHAARVVRVRVGEMVEVFDGKGSAAAARVDSAERDNVRVHILEPIPSREIGRAITVAAALIHPDKFELILQKCTELGATRFLPVLSDEVETRVERVLGKLSRWQKIVQEAAKQCGRATIPECNEPVEFKAVLDEPATRILFDADTPASDWSPRNDAAPLALLIGPEGGWSPKELALAHSRGVVVRHLGPRRLRAETAAIAAMTTIVSEIEEW
jgi:16S rRNA (uracil1498-N3)-methyltransferase